MAGLIAKAETAQDIAAAFNKFLEPVSDSSTEITGLISELFAISSAARELSNAFSDPRYRGRKILVEEDTRTVLLSIDYTFNDITRLFGGLDRPTYFTKREAYRGVWNSIIRHFQDESTDTLIHRLELYRLFLLDLSEIIHGYGERRGTPDLRYRIEKLVLVQNARLEPEFGNLSLGGPTPRQRSYERVRPFDLEQDPPFVEPSFRRQRPEPPIREPSYRRPRPESPVRESSYRRRPVQSPPEDPRYRTRPADVSPEGIDGWMPEVQPPFSPVVDFEYGFYYDLPDSPTATTTNSTTTGSTQSSSPSSILETHWLPAVFNQSRPTTAFGNIGQASACYGPDMPGASSKIGHDYGKILELPFETGELVVRLYVRPTDLRARIHCKTSRSGRPPSQSSLPITQLRIIRAASCLQLAQPRSDRTLKLWANLRFPSYERMILFYCTFLALKVQDECNPIRELEDHILAGEVLIFSGSIIDDSFEHVLRVYRDRDSGGIRLLAAARSGQLKEMPVWTAFITYQIQSRSWMRRSQRRNIHLRELQRYIFSNEYMPQFGPGGEHELSFLDPKDAQDFMEVIYELAEDRG